MGTGSNEVEAASAPAVLDRALARMRAAATRGRAYVALNKAYWRTSWRRSLAVSSSRSRCLAAVASLCCSIAAATASSRARCSIASRHTDSD